MALMIFPKVTFLFYCLIYNILFTNIEVYGYFLNLSTYTKDDTTIPEENISIIPISTIINKFKLTDAEQNIKKRAFFGKESEKDLYKQWMQKHHLFSFRSYPTLKKSAEMPINYKYSIKSNSDRDDKKIKKEITINNKYFPISYLRVHTKDFRHIGSEMQNKYLTKSDAAVDKQTNVLLSDTSQSLKRFANNLTDLNKTPNIYHNGSLDDPIRINIYQTVLKEQTDRQKKESEFKKMTSNDTTKTKKSRRDETLFIVLAMAGLAAFILIMSCTVFIIVRKRGRMKKSKKYNKSKENHELPTHTNETASVHDVQSSTFFDFELEKKSVRNISKENSSYADSEYSVTHEPKQYAVKNSIRSFSLDSGEKFIIQDAKNSSKEQNIASNECVSQKRSLPSNVGGSYSISKESHQDTIPVTRSDSESIIVGETDFSGGSYDSFDKSRGPSNSIILLNMNNCLNMEEGIGTKKTVSSNYSNNDIKYLQNKYMYEYLDSDKLPKVKRKAEKNNYGNHLSEVLQKEQQVCSVFENDKSVSSQKSKRHKILHLKSSKRSNDCDGNIYFKNNDECKLRSSLTSFQHVHPSVDGTVGTEKCEPNLNIASEMLNSSDKSENGIENPWERIIMNIKPSSSHRNESKGVEQIGNRKIIQQNAIAEQSKGSLDDESKLSTSVAFDGDLHPVYKMHKKGRNQVLKAKREKSVVSKIQNWNYIIANMEKCAKDFSNLTRFNNQMIINNFKP